MPCHGTRTGIINPMLFSSIRMSSPSTSTSNSYQPSFYQANPTWPPPSVSTPSVQYPGNRTKPERYHLRSETRTTSTPSMSGPLYDDYEATMELWHQFAADQMLRGEPVLMPYGVHYLRNTPQPTGEMREDVQEEPRLHTLKARPEDHAPTVQFDNQLDQALLLVDYIQTKTRVFELIDELEIMTEKLADIMLGLEQSSTCGTH